MVNRPIEDFRPEEIAVSVANAFELDADRVAVACQLSAEAGSINRYYILELTVPGVRLDVTRQANFYLKGYSRANGVEMCLEVGNVLYSRAAGAEWEQAKFEPPFLQDCLVDGPRFVFGAEGRLFASTGGDYVRQETEATSRLMAMGKGPEDLFYVVGERGTLLRGRTGAWTRVDLGMGVHLRSVCAIEEKVLIGGENGYLAILAGDELIEIDTGLTGDILSICWHKGVTYVADSSFGISILEGTALRPYAEIGYVYRLNSGTHFLTCATDEFVYQFGADGLRGVEFYFEDGLKGIEADTEGVID